MTTRRPRFNPELERLTAEGVSLAEENKRLRVRIQELTPTVTNKGDAASQAEKAKKREREEKQGKVTNVKEGDYNRG